MKKKLVPLLLLLGLVLGLRAQEAEETSWREMIDSAELIALVEYTSEGAVYARARPLVTYRGPQPPKEIWITGFSDPHRAIDTMRQGDRHLVFLRPHAATTDDTSREGAPIPQAYREAQRWGHAYTVWSPSVGNLPVQKKRVQYDLLRTTQHRHLPFHPLAEFEAFLLATGQTDRTQLQRRLLKKAKAKGPGPTCARYLMLLYLSGFDRFDPVYCDIAAVADPEASLALARLLGQVPDTVAQDLLLHLLDQPHQGVQEAAVDQLALRDPAVVGPLLRDKLGPLESDKTYTVTRVDTGSIYINRLQVKIIRTLHQLRYQPATEALLPLLQTDHVSLFRLVVNVIHDLGSKAYLPYFLAQFRRPNDRLLYWVCQFICQHDLVECRPAMLDLLRHCDRNKRAHWEFLLSRRAGIAHFADSLTVDFLRTDFERFLAQRDTIRSKPFRRWIGAYVEAFAHLECAAARPLVYESFFHWFGYAPNFVPHADLFALKWYLEDSLNSQARLALPDYAIAGVRSLVFVGHTTTDGQDFDPRRDALILVELAPPQTVLGAYEMQDKLLELRQVLSKRLDLPLIKISARYDRLVSNPEERFAYRMDLAPVLAYYAYFRALPRMEDLRFLRALRQHEFTANCGGYCRRSLDGTIAALEEMLR